MCLRYSQGCLLCVLSLAAFNASKVRWFPGNLIPLAMVTILYNDDHQNPIDDHQNTNKDHQNFAAKKILYVRVQYVIDKRHKKKLTCITAFTVQAGQVNP